MELIFVYNANSGKWNGYMDIMHKIFSPKTYPCSLCDITYGTFKIREEWAEFKNTLDIPLTFLHKDEWLEQYGIKDKLPAVFIKEDNKIKNWIPAETLDQQELGSLKNLIKEKLEMIKK
ncbi:hypothetical protein MATR_10920 [Marivirga tractuosa]|uniref:GTPase n=1 Tax=Marivirga tractuosa (strain ATCC 23168 / DSM 4126 / NBRC 15989 / NCIMB 1408 / VKM B-1430 / H-43) TaxID=643867 RepID=E4TLF8_MARTH|nr:hypothetical protein [Marivirga tractuosa]ADR21279.1 hypothetical protein Ftrac_1288 [Marivirga tractuosa DSM 4126]BDD14267.1 hypothetical protein MATR_10920 [Marivirga tractuosa]